MNTDERTIPHRPLSVAHLIFGVVFTGIAAVWLIGEANDSDVSGFAVGFPAVLVGAGVIGLIASIWSVRRNRARLADAGSDQNESTAPYAETTHETTHETPDDTVVLTEENQS